jgi:two-component system KDP operon response regulator KdpE
MHSGSFQSLIVASDLTLARLVERSLTMIGSVNEFASSGGEALSHFGSKRFDFVSLQVPPADMSVPRLIRQLRVRTECGIIALGPDDDRGLLIEALEAGADDYLTIPFPPREFRARARALLRRCLGGVPGKVYDVGEAVVDLSQNRIIGPQGHSELTPIERRLLLELIRNEGRVVSQEELMSAVWGPGYESSVPSLYVHISSLRRKLERDPARPEHIRTHRGIGYRFLR